MDSLGGSNEDIPISKRNKRPEFGLWRKEGGPTGMGWWHGADFMVDDAAISWSLKKQELLRINVGNMSTRVEILVED